MTTHFLERLSGAGGKSIILASQSPRRIELLKSAGIDFNAVPADVDENPSQYRDSIDFVAQNALAKARWVADRHPADLIIGADTIVVVQDHIMGKPLNRQDAAAMLKTLSGKEHQVITAIALIFKEKVVIESEVTQVTFYELEEAEIEAYLDTGEPFDKAGAYGIQGFAGVFISGIKGDFYNVIGFPMHRFYRCLRREWR